MFAKLVKAASFIALPILENCLIPAYKVEKINERVEAFFPTQHCYRWIGFSQPFCLNSRKASLSQSTAECDRWVGSSIALEKLIKL